MLMKTVETPCHECGNPRFRKGLCEDHFRQWSEAWRHYRVPVSQG